MEENAFRPHSTDDLPFPCRGLGGLRRRESARGGGGKRPLGGTAPHSPPHHGSNSYSGTPAGEQESDFAVGDQPPPSRVPPELLPRRYTDSAITWIKGVPKGRPFFM